MIDATAPAHEGEAIIAKVMYRAMLATSPTPEITKMYPQNVEKIAKIIARENGLDADEIVKITANGVLLSMRRWEIHYPYIAMRIIEELTGQLFPNKTEMTEQHIAQLTDRRYHLDDNEDGDGS